MRATPSSVAGRRAGRMTSSMELAFEVLGPPEAVLAQLFVDATDGGLAFGPTARSASPRAALDQRARFQDYVMEGFCSFDLKVTRTEAGILLEVYGLGSPRDRYLRSSLRWILAGVVGEFRELR